MAGLVEVAIEEDSEGGVEVDAVFAVAGSLVVSPVTVEGAGSGEAGIG